MTGRARLRASFRETYGAEPTHRVEAPGRVNLIGEHTDYNGLPVLPMAIQRRVSLVLRLRADAMVRVASLQPGFAPRRFALGETIDPFAPGDWGNYAKAAAQTVVRDYGVGRGVDALVDSDIPIAAGLSSSSAVVVACALGLLAANEVAFERLALAEALAAGERYVGVRGGGMDQAICLEGRADSAARIDFEPLRLRQHPVPEAWRFLVAYSLVPAPKSGTAKQTYNRRTRECREALGAVWARLEPDGPGGVQGRPASYAALLAERSEAELLAAADQALDAELGRRFRHVVTEGRRVEEAEAALEADDLSAFGRLMSASHRSLRDDYEVSSPELDGLVEIAEAAGVAGARLTGAGLGGCAVALCTADRLGDVEAALAERFYAPRATGERLEDCLFAARPSRGATVAPL